MRDRARQHQHQLGYFDKQYAAFGAYKLENWRLSYIRRIFPELGLSGKKARPGFAYLDVGVGGSGYTVIEAARLGARASGTDLSPVAVQTATRLAAETLGKASTRARFVASAAEKLPFKSGSFDAVSSIAVLEHVVEHEAAAAEIARVLKPGGRAFVAVPHDFLKTPFLLALINRINDPLVGHLRHYSASELEAVFASAGLRRVKTIYHAHTVKLWQFIKERIDPRLREPGSAEWWRLEQLDFDAVDDERASMISMVFEKPRRARP